MYHLFNKVYVDLTSRVNREQAYVSIGGSVGYEYFPNGSEVPGTQLGYGKSLDSFDEVQFNELIQKVIEHDGKVFIFADGESYLRLYTMYVKALLPGITKDVFKHIMVCRKATYNSLISNLHFSRINMTREMVINNQVVDKLFDFKDPHQETIAAAVESMGKELSLEWRILRLLTEDRIGELPRSLRVLVQRIALSNTQDALDVWGRMIADPSSWEFAGCDADTLLNAETVFAGCTRFMYLSNPIFLKPGLTDVNHPRDWVIKLLKEQIEVLDYCGETSTANCSRLLLNILMNISDTFQLESLKNYIKLLFGTENRLVLPADIAAKYDENLIHYILSADVETLKTIVKGGRW